MNVTVSVFGRFHAFYLAHQLQKREALSRLITSYPKFEVKKYGIAPKNVMGLPYLELLRRVIHRSPDIVRENNTVIEVLHDAFDTVASHNIPTDTDIFIGWSGFSENSLHEANHKRAITILERGSAHIQYQYDILKEEYRLHNLEAELPSESIIQKEIRGYQIADYISLPSKFAHRTFIEAGIPAEKLLVCNLGVGLDEFNQLPKKDNIFRLVFAGRITFRKGIQYVIQAWKELDLPESELWLIGTKMPEVSNLFEQTRNSFKHIEHVPQETLKEYYSQSSVFIMPSIEDGFGVVVPQAMACGLPVICSENTGAADLIEEGKEGFIVPIRDVEALKEKILYLYENQDIAYEMGQAAKRKVQQGLTWDDYGDRMYAEFTRILDEKRNT